MKVLYANGCSMTEGAELGNKKFNYDEAKYGPNTVRAMAHLSDEHRRYMEEHSFPALIGRNLNFDKVINDAVGGSSNRKIARQTILGVHELLKTHKPEDLFVVVSWSSLGRFELPLKKAYYQFVPGHIHPKNFKHLPNDFVAYAKTVEEWQITNLRHCILDHYTAINSAKAYLESKGVQYVFCYGIVSDFSRNFDDKEIEDAFNDPSILALAEMVFDHRWYLGRVLDEKYKDNHIDFFEIMLSLNRVCMHFNTTDNNMPLGNGFHPLEEGHEDWANLLTNKILRDKLCSNL